jgi:hypothetical protein
VLAPPQLVPLLTPPGSISVENLSVLYESPHKTGDGHALGQLYQAGNWVIYRIHQTADYFINRQDLAAGIFYHLHPQADLARHQIMASGLISALWHELNGTIVLHGAAVAIGQQALLILAESGSGKSTLAAQFVAQQYPLLSEDQVLLALASGRYLARPNNPTLRLYPAVAEAVFPGIALSRYPLYMAEKHLIPVSEYGQVCPQALPIAGIYLPKRADGRTDVVFSACGPAERLMALVRHSFVARIVEALGLQGQRLQFLAALANQAPVRYVHYGNGFALLPSVVQAIAGDFAGLG